MPMPGFGPDMLLAAAAAAGEDITTGLVGHWALDDGSGTTAVDSSSGGNNGTLTNGPTWTTGVIGSGAVTLDGANDYINISGFNQSLLPATFTAWAYVAASGDRGNALGLVFSRGGGGAVSGINMGIGIDVAKVGYHWNDAANTYGWTGGSNIPIAKWFLVALVVEATQATMYVYSADGQFSSVNSVSHSSSTINALQIGQDNNGGGREFKGSVDDVRIYNRALTSAQIGALYDLG